MLARGRYRSRHEPIDAKEYIAYGFLSERKGMRQTTIFQRPRKFRTLTPVVKALLWANAVVFVLEWLVASPLSGNMITLLGLSLSGLRARAFWQFGTYMFLHGGFTHLAMNMLALYLIGPAVERSLGKKIFLTLYLFSGFLGGVGYVAMDPAGVCIGASGAVFGIFGAFVALYPRERMVLLFFPFIQFEAWIFALFFMGLELLFLMTGQGGNIAHSAHIAGAVAGYVFVRVLSRQWRVSPGPGFLLNKIRFPFRSTRSAGGPSAQSPSTREVDRILDKVADSGIGSLTNRERAILQAMAGRHRPR